MASTTANMDLTVLGSKVIGALGKKIDELGAFTCSQDSGGSKGDSVKVFVYDKTDDADDFNASSNNYETQDDDTTTGIDVTLSNDIKKTAFIAKDDISKTDITLKLDGLANSVANECVQRVYNIIDRTNFTATEQVLGAASTFTYDDTVDLEVVADDAGFKIDSRYMGLSNEYMANLKKDGVLVANQNYGGDVMGIYQRYQQISNFSIAGSSILKLSDNYAATEYLRGFITDGSGIACAFGVPAEGYQMDDGVEVVRVVSPTGLVMDLRRHYSRATGGIYLNAEVLFGVSVARVAGLVRLVSQTSS